MKHPEHIFQGFAKHRLTIESTVTDVKNYLRHLAQSEYDHHLDDGVDQVANWGEKADPRILDILRRNERMMWLICDATTIWECYGSEWCKRLAQDR